MSPPRFVVIALVVALTSAASTADAQSSSAEASDHHRAGVAYAKSGKWEQAVREFEEAYKLDPTPLRLYDVGQVCLQAKQYVRARDAYAKVVNSAALSADQQQRARAGLATAKSKVARVRITVVDPKPSDAIAVDGVKAEGDTVDIDPGKHTVRLVRDGEATEMNVDVAPGGEAAVTLGEKKAQERPQERPPSEEGGGAGGGASDPSSGGTPAAAWILSGVAVAAVGTGVTLMVIGNDEYQEVKDSGCDPRCDGRDEPGRQKVLIGNIVLGAGILSGLAAAYFFIWGGNDKPTPKRSSWKNVDVGLGPSGGLIGVRGSF